MRIEPPARASSAAPPRPRSLLLERGAHAKTPRFLKEGAGRFLFTHMETGVCACGLWGLPRGAYLRGSATRTSWFFTLTREWGATLFVRNALPPMTEPSPTTVSPPSTLAFE